MDSVTQYWQQNALSHIMPVRGNAKFPEGTNIIDAAVTCCRGRVLEFGCGRGRLSGFFGDYIGVDICAKAIDIAKEKHPQHEFLLIEPFAELPDADTVFAYTVLHHIPAEKLVEIAIQFDRFKHIVIAEIMDPKWINTSMPPCLNRDREVYDRLFGNHFLDDIQRIKNLAYDAHTTILCLNR